METEDYKMEIDNPVKEKTIKTALNDISSDLSTLSVDVKSMSEQLPTLATTREEVNSFKLLVENYNQTLDTALVVIQRGVDVRLGPIKLSETHYNALDDINTQSVASLPASHYAMNFIPFLGHFTIDQKQTPCGRRTL